LLKDEQYYWSLIKMGLRHGKDFDCIKEDCEDCVPFREVESEIWKKMSNEEKLAVHFGRIG
jgi:hypothetical protein